MTPFIITTEEALPLSSSSSFEDNIPLAAWLFLWLVLAYVAVRTIAKPDYR